MVGNCHANRSFAQRTKTMSDVGLEFCQHFTEGCLVVGKRS